MFHHYFLSLRKKEKTKLVLLPPLCYHHLQQHQQFLLELHHHHCRLRLLWHQGKLIIQKQSHNREIIERKNSILNFPPKIDASRDFAKDPFRPVNIKSPELTSCGKEILDSHCAAAEIQNKRRIKSLAITEGKIKKQNRIVAETNLGRSLLKSKPNTLSSLPMVTQCESLMIPLQSYILGVKKLKTHLRT